jgi:DNA-binding CsgD family transcriptional regulator
MRLPADDGDLRWRAALSALLLAIAIGGAIDLWMDRGQHPGAAHLAFELAMLLLSLGAFGALWVGWARDRRSLAEVRRSADVQRAEHDAWRARAEKLLRGLGEAIDAQMRAWELTPAEREVALLLLKGYGHKEIAVLLERSERTVRQHAVAVYRKSGLAGRAELAAFFLEDLLLPTPESDAATPAQRSAAP